MVILTFGLRMAKQSSLMLFINAKLYVMYGLAFLVVVFFDGCNNSAQKLEIIWENNQAIGIAIPKNGSDLDSLKVINVVPIFGSFIAKNNGIEFRSIIPLTAGLSYEIWNGKNRIGKVAVPFPAAKLAPVLAAIYPQRDTVPENLLKLYFRFSKPMQTGKSLEHIFILDKNSDTMRNVFLNLQPELWDTSGKILTLWLDPGRIKRDLVLNKKLGNPLMQNAHYQLIVSNRWKDTQGLRLTKTYSKSFVVAAADGEVPDVNKWSLALPASGTKRPLIIDTKEAMDHFLLMESVTILGPKNEIVEGEIKIKEDQIWEFTPLKPWLANKYQLQVNTRLEDLAANNLNKVFDRDIRKEKGRDDDVVKRAFFISLPNSTKP